jgi:FecR-like protein
MTSRRITATSARAAFGALVGALFASLVTTPVSGPAVAQQPQQGAAYVSNLSGPLFAVKSDGSRRVLSTQSVVNVGDTLITEDKTYARVRFSDTSEVTLRPSTQFQIENYAFERAAPEKDNSAFRLLKGAFRTVTGLIGKRGNQDAYKIQTSTATIGIRGSSGDTLECTSGCPGATPTSDKLSPGVYHATYLGVYVMSNDQGQQILGVGQFGFAGPGKPPVLLPADPGLNLRDMPVTFGLGVGRRAPGPGPAAECVVQ